ERRTDPREGNIVGGRSINLAVSTRGIHALEQLGIANEVLKHAIPMRGRMIHPATAGRAPIFVPYDVDPKNCINSIGRAALNTTDAYVRRFFDEEFADAVPLMPTLLDDFQQNPTGSLVTICCAPWSYKDKLALVGDAAHAVVPFYGQGMNAAFEDCVVLDECL